MLLLPPRWRAWMAAVLLLALPLQGLAAACMLGCGVGFGMAGAVSTAAGAQAAQAGHAGHGSHLAAGDAEMSHQGQHIGHVESHQPGHGNSAAGEHHSPHGAQTQHGKHPTQAAELQPQGNDADSGCSACAACFVGAALPACEAQFPAQGQPQGMTAGATPGLSLTSPDGLERPPRADRA